MIGCISPQRTISYHEPIARVTVAFWRMTGQLHDA